MTVAAPGPPPPTEDRSPTARAPWRAVAVPAEHGGWALTLEPIVLGLLVAPSVAGALLGAAAFVAFLARTPVKVVLVDRWRGRWLARTRLAAVVAVVELVALVGLVVGAIVSSGGPALLLPLVVAAPAVALELWFDMRSRGRRLVPEIAGTLGMAAVASAIVVAGGAGAGVAAAAWLVLAVRAVATLGWVRDQVRRAKGQPVRPRVAAALQLGGVATAVVAVAVGWWPLPILVAVGVLVAVQVVLARRPPIPAAAIGVTQLVLGLLVVVTAGLTLG